MAVRCDKLLCDATMSTVWQPNANYFRKMAPVSLSLFLSFSRRKNYLESFAGEKNIQRRKCRLRRCDGWVLSVYINHANNTVANIPHSQTINIIKSAITSGTQTHTTWFQYTRSTFTTRSALHFDGWWQPHRHTKLNLNEICTWRATFTYAFAIFRLQHLCFDNTNGWHSIKTLITSVAVLLSPIITVTCPCDVYDGHKKSIYITFVLGSCMRA